MLKVGERAPEFTLPDETGADRSLTELLSSGAIILYFTRPISPPDARARPAHCGTCTRRFRKPACGSWASALRSRSRMPSSARNTSCPSSCSPMSTRPSSRCMDSTGPLGLGVRRATYLIDGSRRVRDSVLADLRIGRHMDFVRKAIMLRAASS